MQLSAKDQQRLAEFYKESLREHGPSRPQAVRWTGYRNQLSRFDVLCQIADLSGHSVLDVGCGLGDLSDFLQKHFQNCEYLGIDLVPELLAAAKNNYPDAAFELTDIFKFAPESWDYVLASGALTFNVEQGKNFYYAMIEQMFKVAKKGLAFNMLDDYYYEADQDFLAYSPEELDPFLEKLDPDYRLIRGYAPGDFTVHLLK